MTSYNLAQSVYRRSQSKPDAVAVSCEGKTLTYGEFARVGSGLARRLQAGGRMKRLTDGTPPRIGILANRSAEACAAALGTTWAGATYVPLGVTFPEDRLLKILSLCDLSAIIADQLGAERLTDTLLAQCPADVIALAERPDGARVDDRIEWLSIDALKSHDMESLVQVEANDVAYIMFTSGSTGTPKGVMVPAGAVRHYARIVTEMLGMTESDRSLGATDMTFDVAGQDMYVTWEAGASLHVLPASKGMSAVKFARTNELTIFNTGPSLVGRLRQLKTLNPNALPNVRITIFGGEQLPRGIVEAWREAAPNSAVYNFYGPTEATIYCLTQQVGNPILVTPGRDVVSIGTPLGGNEAAVVDSNGNPVPDGSTGELALAGVQLALGYLNAPEQTASRFPTYQGKRWYLTGDLAMRDASGNFHCFGRVDNQVKILGYRIELEEVDAHLRAVCDADLVGTVAWPYTDGAPQGLVAFIGQDSANHDHAQIMAAMRSRVPSYMVPSRVVPLENMPLNTSGKVDRKALLQILQQM